MTKEKGKGQPTKKTTNCQNKDGTTTKNGGKMKKNTWKHFIRGWLFGNYDSRGGAMIIHNAKTTQRAFNAYGVLFGYNEGNPPETFSGDPDSLYDDFLGRVEVWIMDSEETPSLENDWLYDEKWTACWLYHKFTGIDGQVFQGKVEQVLVMFKDNTKFFEGGMSARMAVNNVPQDVAFVPLNAEFWLEDACLGEDAYGLCPFNAE